MASQEVLLSTCDRCTTEVKTPLTTRKGKKDYPLLLPPGWIHISATTATTLVFEMDLCEDCKKIVLELAGKAPIVHTTTSKGKGKGKGKQAEATSESAPETGASNPDDDSDGGGLHLVEAG